MQMSRRQFFRVCGAGIGGSSLALMGFSPQPALAEARTFKLSKTTEHRSTCPYCSVSCGVLIYSTGDKSKNAKADIIHIEGDVNPACRQIFRELMVHYKGEPPMWVDMASGQLQVVVGSYQAYNTVAGRGIRPIGVTGNYRCPKLPDLPTLIEQGANYPLVRLEGGLPLTARSGTPEHVLQRAAQIAVQWAETDKAKALRDSFAIPDKPGGLEDTRKIWRDIAPQWIRIATELGITLD